MTDLGRFIQQSNDRHLPDDYDGPILLWDIDKTYLDTRFSSFRGLISIPLELAVDKQAVPGAVPLLRALRRGPGPQSALTPLYFVSGSPPQLRKVIQTKMTLDGVQYDGITFKDQMGLLMARRPKDIKRQVGYKLTALLGYRRRVPARAQWLMFGDDVENDAEAFLLFGQVVAGLRGPRLEDRLQAAHVHDEDRAIIHELVASLPEGPDPVSRVFILLANKTDPERFTDPRVMACRSYLQTSLVLAMEGRITPDTVPMVARGLRRNRVPEQTIAEELRDAERRLHVPRSLTELARA
ncbi:MAG: hypothetical protein H6730_30240 [Deltaproteobacteria bacterium]|nr:hypothetical protein [Deltaproteobacteria bacterium]